MTDTEYWQRIAGLAGWTLIRFRGHRDALFSALPPGSKKVRTFLIDRLVGDVIMDVAGKFKVKK